MDNQGLLESISQSICYKYEEFTSKRFDEFLQDLNNSCKKVDNSYRYYVNELQIKLIEAIEANNKEEIKRIKDQINKQYYEGLVIKARNINIDYDLLFLLDKISVIKNRINNSWIIKYDNIIDEENDYDYSDYEVIEICFDKDNICYKEYIDTCYGYGDPIYKVNKIINSNELFDIIFKLC